MSNAINKPGFKRKTKSKDTEQREQNDLMTYIVQNIFQQAR